MPGTIEELVIMKPYLGFRATTVAPSASTSKRRWQLIRPWTVPGQPMRSRLKAKKPRKFNNLRGFQIGRRDWTRTNDPHHVKVVL